MAKGFSFGKIQFRDDDTLFTISYNGTIRFIINKTTGSVTFGAVDGTGAVAITADGVQSTTGDFTGQLNIALGEVLDMNINGQLAIEGTTSVLKVSRLTATQRDALTPAQGMIVFNTTATKLQVYNGLAWADLH